MRKRILVLLGMVLLAASLHAKSAFSGTYAVKGNNPGVGPYTGTLTITPTGDVYTVHWAIGNLQYWGVGVVVNDTLSVAYSDTAHSWMGVIGYRAKADGSLEGKWAVQGRQGPPGTETATRK